MLICISSVSRATILVMLEVSKVEGRWAIWTLTRRLGLLMNPVGSDPRRARYRPRVAQEFGNLLMLCSAA